MTMENRNFVGLADLLGVEVKCQQVGCGALVLIPVECRHELPDTCPTCKNALFLKDGQLSYVREFIKAIGNIETRKIGNIRIEISAQISN